jgi:aspartyl-tRNA(Asn)/glutamyl-tRNA(Gln) amidotransferase subunit C
MTAFDRAAIKHVAELASLSLSDDEADRLTGDIQRILAYVDELETVDTSNVEPTLVGALGEGSALRPDQPEACLLRAEVLAGAPRANEQGFLVPTFVES